MGKASKKPTPPRIDSADADAMLFAETVEKGAAARARIEKREREKGSADGGLGARPFAKALAPLREELARSQATRTAARAPKTPAPQPPKEAEADPARVFAEAMAGVAPLPEDHSVPASKERPERYQLPDDDAEVMAELADLVSGVGHFDSSFSDEHIEGISEGLDRRLLRKLKRGAFSHRSHLDLHGFTRAEARPQVERFLANARTRGERCVLLVHGRGLHSKEGVPVLKEAVNSWLLRGRISKSVLAFCSARPSDGGLGALYVLLRK